MLARRTLARVPTVAAQGPASSARNMATLREIETRLKSVRNIEKITKVSYSRLSNMPTWFLLTPPSLPVNKNDSIYKARSGPTSHERSEEIRHCQCRAIVPHQTLGG